MAGGGLTGVQDCGNPPPAWLSNPHQMVPCWLDLKWQVMRIVHLSIRNFRGIHSLEWSPPAEPVCLVGAGDTGKSTVLDAIELALLPRAWVQFVESDFYSLTTTEAIEIEATMVDVPSHLLSQDKFGLDQRGWTSDGEIHDEPQDEDEPALTVRLRVDDSLEPGWTVVSERNPGGRAISGRDREALGVARIGDEVDRQLSWTRGSSLTRVTGDPQSISTALAEAHRTAREAVSQAEFPQLSETADKVGQWGIQYGAQLDVPLTVGVDPKQLNVGGSALSLRQASGIPARSTGLGSRRLLALAAQRQALGTDVVILVDEVEHGLEPHRLLHLLRELRESNSQVLMTSHSETAVAELGSSGIGLLRRDTDGNVRILHPDTALQGVIRTFPGALLSRKVVVCEGSTEWGIARGLVSHWDEDEERALAWRGTIFVAGRGGDAPKRVAGLGRLEFQCAYWGDSDVPTDPSADELTAMGVDVIQWSDNLNTEQRIMADVPDEVLEDLWEIAVDERDAQTVANQLGAMMGVEGPPPRDWAQWSSAFSLADLRPALGNAAARSGWYKSTTAGQRVGAVIAPILNSIEQADLAVKLENLRRFAYGD